PASTFVLDMGTPIRIADLAAQMIRLAGYEPGRDIEIAYTGLRPGEKLSEGLSASPCGPENGIRRPNPARPIASPSRQPTPSVSSRSLQLSAAAWGAPSCSGSNTGCTPFSA
ncbi:MAG: polysaccharide biosynthesis protein, partial [Pseudomonadota bacterium]